MFGSEILETVIGLIFVYLLLSVIVSSAKELIESLLKKRATDLERGIRLLLDDKDKTGLAKKLFEHPLICCLYQYRYGADGTIIPESLPSYIPAQSFALALMDIVCKAEPDWPSGAAGALAPTDAATVVTETPGEAQPLKYQAVSAVESIAQFRDAVTVIENDKVRAALLALVDAAGNDARRVRENIEAWFNSTMDRVTGWYRRWTQGVIFGVGLALTVALNADTIAICGYLSQNPEARAKLIEAAEKAVQPTPPPTTPTDPEPPVTPANPAPRTSPPGDTENRPLPPPPQGNAGNAPPPASAPPTPASDTGAKGKTESELDQLKKNLQAVNGLGLPIGWSQLTWDWPTGFARVLGWLLTAIAISLGAPFWFNLLNKFMDIRSAAKADNKPSQPGESGVKT